MKDKLVDKIQSKINKLEKQICFYQLIPMLVKSFFHTAAFLAMTIFLQKGNIGQPIAMIVSDDVMCNMKLQERHMINFLIKYSQAKG